MQGELDGFEARDARVVAIGQGTGADAARLAETLHLGFPVLGDPERESYRLLGLRRDSWWGLIGRPLVEHPGRALRDIADADLRASASRYSDPKQLGGVAIVDRAGTLRYLRRAGRSDDLPDNAELFAALDDLPVAGGAPVRPPLG